MFLVAEHPYDSVFIYVRRPWENNAYSSKTNQDNFTEFYINPPHIFLIAFDLRGQIWTLRPK